MRRMSNLTKDYEMPIKSLENFKIPAELRLDELKQYTQTLIDNSKYLNFHEKKIIKKKNELENLKLKLDDEEKENFDRYQKLMDNGDLLTSFNMNFNEMITSIDMGNLDHLETKGSDEVMKEINYLREQISKNLNDISTIDSDLETREHKFSEEFNKLDKEKMELYKKLEDEFIINSHLYFESDRSNVIFKNLKSDYINDENVGDIIQGIRKSMTNFNNLKISFSMDNIYNRGLNKSSKKSVERSPSPTRSKSPQRPASRNKKTDLSINASPITKHNRSNVTTNSTFPLKNLKNLNNSDANNSLNLQLNTKGSLVTGVKLNRTFFAIRQKKENERAKDSSSYEADYCRKHCGERLFKNLDLSQRYYLNKGNKINLHSENCPIFIRENFQARSSSIPTSHREKRKMNTVNNKDEIILNASAIKTITNGVLDNSIHSNKNNTSKNINNISGYSNDPSFEFETRENQKGNSMHSRRKSN